MRKHVVFNDDWMCAPEPLPLNAPDENFENITLPHTNKLFTHNNIDNLAYQFISTYRKRFDFKDELSDKVILLEFGGVMLASTIYLNDKLMCENKGGYAPFNVNCTREIKKGENVLTVYVDSRERKDIPPYGHLVDYLTFGGIYRDVILKILPPTHIENAFVKTASVLTSPQLSCEVRLNRFLPGMILEANLFDMKGSTIAQTRAVVAGLSTILTFNALPQVHLWELDNPNLYTLRVSLLKNALPLDILPSRFGFREAEFREDGGFYLNGNRIDLFGLNRHQTYPYIGAAAPKRLQRQDADILKYELACNIVRTSHYPQSTHFLDRCDEIGLLVFEEITGWQHIGDEKWQTILLDELKTMIERDRNRPSIILWGVRVNESGDDNALYTQTNRLAHDLDPTRQTGGVRCFQGSSFLENVYTYNDFSNTLQEATEVPYLVTEFAGHMFPTKIWDHEERLIDHALLHAKIHNLQMGNKQIAGAIGWCAFDYATHIEFGSGDRICYHGVMDTFRLPKWAAYFYRSQIPPVKEVVLKAATHWTMGDRSGGGNDPLTIFSNCEEVEVIIGTINIGKFKPDFESYPHLQHPPIIVNGLDQFSAWGQRQFYDLHLIGYINGEQVAQQSVASNQLPQKLTFTSDSDQLFADGADMTRLIFKVTDAFGNSLPYAFMIVEFDVEGEADLIGENPFPLIGGQAAVYLKARHQTGKVTVRATASGLPGTSLTIDIVPVDYSD